MSEHGRDAVAAGGVAAVLSGVPSTVLAIARGENPLEGALAAGSILLPREERTAPLLAAATLTHGALSLSWASVLAVALPRHRSFAWATAAALGIAALDLGVIGRRFARIRALSVAPQLADHLAYTWSVAAVLRHLRRVKSREVV